MAEKETVSVATAPSGQARVPVPTEVLAKHIYQLWLVDQLVVRFPNGDPGGIALLLTEINRAVAHHGFVSEQAELIPPK